MKEYLSGSMQQEEMHAAEVHLSACPLCSMAMDGFETNSEEALTAIASLNSGFLKEHFDNIAPQIHLNSMAPAAAMPAAQSSRKSAAIQPWWRKASIAAAILLAFGALWYLEFGRAENIASSPIAKTSPPQSLPSEDNEPAAGQELATVSGKEDSDDKDAVADVARPAADIQTASAPVKAIVKSEAADANEIARPLAATGRTVKQREEAVAALSASTAQPKEAVPIIAATEARPSRRALDPDVPAAQAWESPSSTAAGQTMEAKHVAEDLKPKLAAKAAPTADRSPMELGQESYDKGKYSAALNQYKRQMNAGSPQERAQAKLMAARCYTALGKKAKASELLQSVVDEGNGPQRRAARRLLRELEVQSQAY
jgi:FimV-like protein